MSNWARQEGDATLASLLLDPAGWPGYFPQDSRNRVESALASAQHVLDNALLEFDVNCRDLRKAQYPTDATREADRRYYTTMLMGALAGFISEAVVEFLSEMGRLALLGQL